MSRSFDTLHDLLHHGADTLIDVRSPAEFAEDHVPGAINLPALSNAQRAEVGTMYVRDSAFKARKMGAAMVARNVAAHLEGPLASKDGGWQPIVYCWRGGQRSGSFASILQQIGWRADTVAGGYQTYRRLIYQCLYDAPLPHRHMVLLDGNTGTGKTALLARLRTLDTQTIDLEDLAHHRGSLLGARDGAQPSQKQFETRLAVALTACDIDKPIVLEAESSKIGRINIPPSLWKCMCAAPRIMVRADINDRARYLAAAYKDIAAQPTTVRERVAPLRRVRGHKIVDRWETLLDARDHVDLAAALITDHYDPAYVKSRDAQTFTLLGDVTAENLDDEGLTIAAHAIKGLLRDLG